MNLRNGAGSGLSLASVASGMASLNPPANRNRAARAPWTIHRTTRTFLVVNGIGVAPAFEYGAGLSGLLLERRVTPPEIDTALPRPAVTEVARGQVDKDLGWSERAYPPATAPMTSSGSAPAAPPAGGGATGGSGHPSRSQSNNCP